MKDEKVDVSVVMPCLNEEETLGTCIEKAQLTLRSLGICGEIIVADNGSTDASAISERLGARVVYQRGYGAAYLTGIAAVQGQYIIMGDSDDTYDFTDLERFITPLREGYDLVMGNRFKSEILPGAMPWARRYISNPILSGILRVLFSTSISDFYLHSRNNQSYQSPMETHTATSPQRKVKPPQNKTKKGKPSNTFKTPAGFYQVIIDNNLFRPLGWYPPVQTPQYALLGTAIATDTTTHTKAFIVERRSGQLHIVRVDDQISDARVKGIKAKRVILQAGDKEIILESEQLQFF